MTPCGRVADLMPIQATKPPKAVNFERSYSGTPDQARHVRDDLGEITAECPVGEELLLLASELATNAIVHSRSGHPGRTFTVRATLYPGDYAWVEVVDLGGPWVPDEQDEEHGRGLGIVAAVAGDGNWGVEGNAASRVAWFRLDWQRF